MISLLHGDCLALLPTLPAESVQCVVTSPPYFGLRSYLPDGHTDKVAELGLEASPQEYVDRLVAVFREVRRVMRPDATAWLNLGDSYAGSSAGGFRPVWDSSRGQQGGARNRNGLPRVLSFKPKDLMMIPARVALALQQDGWWLRSKIIWAKPNPMPESCQDRPTSSYEEVFLLTRAERYFYDADAIAEPSVSDHPSGNGYKLDARLSYRDDDGARGNDEQWVGVGGSRNARNVWTIATTPYPGAHFATMPPALAERCIKAGTSERGQCPHCGAPWVRVVVSDSTVNARNERIADYDVPGLAKGKAADRARRLDGKNYIHVRSSTNDWSPSCACPAHEPVPQTVIDPFAGAATTLLVADRLQRHGLGIELNAEYHDLARARIEGDCPLFAEVA